MTALQSSDHLYGPHPDSASGIANTTRGCCHYRHWHFSPPPKLCAAEASFRIRSTSVHFSVHFSDKCTICFVNYSITSAWRGLFLALIFHEDISVQTCEVGEGYLRLRVILSDEKNIFLNLANKFSKCKWIFFLSLKSILEFFPLKFHACLFQSCGSWFQIQNYSFTTIYHSTKPNLINKFIYIVIHYYYSRFVFIMNIIIIIIVVVVVAPAFSRYVMRDKILVLVHRFTLKVQML